MYSFSILVPMRLVQPSQNTSCLVTNLYSSQTTFFCSSSSYSVMFSMQGTHLGAEPNCGMKQHPILGSSRAARIMPVPFTTVNMLMPESGSMDVQKLDSLWVIFICFLFEISTDLLLSSVKWMEFMGSLQDDFIWQSLRSNRKSYMSTCPFVPTPSSSPLGSHFTQLTSLPWTSRLHILFLSLKSQISTPPSPPQASMFSFSLNDNELIMLSVWKEVRNLPSSKDILYISWAEAETQRFALMGLYSRSRGQWGILVLQWAPYWAWKSMDRSCWAITILLQSSDSSLNLTTQLSIPLRHFNESSAVSKILICGAQIPVATIQRWSLEISTWLVATQNWKSWISYIRFLNSSLQRSDLWVFFASYRNWGRVLPADMLYVFMPFIYVILYIFQQYQFQLLYLQEVGSN